MNRNSMSFSQPARNKERLYNELCKIQRVLQSPNERFSILSNGTCLTLMSDDSFEYDQSNLNDVDEEEVYPAKPIRTTSLDMHSTAKPRTFRLTPLLIKQHVLTNLLPDRTHAINNAPNNGQIGEFASFILNEIPQHLKQISAAADTMEILPFRELSKLLREKDMLLIKIAQLQVRLEIEQKIKEGSKTIGFHWRSNKKRDALALEQQLLSANKVNSILEELWMSNSRLVCFMSTQLEHNTAMLSLHLTRVEYEKNTAEMQHKRAAKKLGELKPLFTDSPSLSQFETLKSSCDRLKMKCKFLSEELDRAKSGENYEMLIERISTLEKSNEHLEMENSQLKLNLELLSLQNQAILSYQDLEADPVFEMPHSIDNINNTPPALSPSPTITDEEDCQRMKELSLSFDSKAAETIQVLKETIDHFETENNNLRALISKYESKKVVESQVGENQTDISGDAINFLESAVCDLETENEYFRVRLEEMESFRESAKNTKKLESELQNNKLQLDELTKTCEDYRNENQASRCHWRILSELLLDPCEESQDFAVNFGRIRNEILRLQNQSENDKRYSNANFEMFSVAKRTSEVDAFYGL